MVPASDVRLFSPQDYFRGLKSGSYLMNSQSTWLTLPSGIQLEIPYHHSNNLPMLFIETPSVSAHLIEFDELTSAAIHLNVAYERNQNLSEA